MVEVFSTELSRKELALRGFPMDGSMKATLGNDIGQETN